MNSLNTTMGVTALANAYAETLSDDALALAALLFTQFGDTLATISLQRSYVPPNISRPADDTLDKEQSATS